MLDALNNRWRRLRADASSGRRDPQTGSLLERIAAPEILREAWRRVRANKGGPGADRVTIATFEQQLDSNLSNLAGALRDGWYRPGRLRRTAIVKPDGRMRKLAIPDIRDRVAQTATLVVIGPVLDPRPSELSFGYRPGRGVSDAIAAVSAAFRAGHVWTLDADLSCYFDRVPHRRLLDELTIWLDQEDVVSLFALWLKSFSRFGRGIAQGSPISPLLANLFLHPLDRLVAAAGCTMVRYADDFVVLAVTEKELQKAQAVIGSILKRRTLALNVRKTRVVPPGREFIFLGHAFSAPVLPGTGHALA